MATENETIAFVVGACLMVYWITSPNNLIQEKSVYYEFCKNDFEHNVFSCPSGTDVMKLDYKIIIERQIVVGKGGYTHQSCSVFDADNWVCDKGQGNTISMRDGNFYESADLGSVDEKGQKSILPRYNQIWALTYYIRSTTGFFRNFF
jgi:hypothetical protein